MNKYLVVLFGLVDCEPIVPPEPTATVASKLPVVAITKLITSPTFGEGIAATRLVAVGKVTLPFEFRT